MIRKYSHADLACSDCQAEPSGGPYIVETSGYVPKEDQLQMLLNSGAALDKYMRTLYPPISELDDEEVIDRTAQKDYDFEDYYNDIAIVRNNFSHVLSEREKLANAQSVVQSVVQTPDPAPATVQDPAKDP